MANARIAEDVDRSAQELPSGTDTAHLGWLRWQGRRDGGRWASRSEPATRTGPRGRGQAQGWRGRGGRAAGMEPGMFVKSPPGAGGARLEAFDDQHGAGLARFAPSPRPTMWEGGQQPSRSTTSTAKRFSPRANLFPRSYAGAYNSHPTMNPRSFLRCRFQRNPRHLLRSYVNPAADR